MMNNGIIAIGGLLALYGVKSRLGSGIRLSKGIYIDNLISITSIDDLEYSDLIDVWDQGKDIPLPSQIIFDNFVNYFKIHALSLSEIGFKIEEIDHISSFSYDGDYRSEEERFFKLKTMIPKAEIIVSVVLDGNYIDTHLFCYIEPNETPATSKNFSLLFDIARSISDFCCRIGLKNRLYTDEVIGNISRLQYNQVWNDILLELSQENGFYPDEASYAIQTFVHQAGSPYNIFKSQGKPKSKLRKR